MDLFQAVERKEIRNNLEFMFLGHEIDDSVVGRPPSVQGAGARKTSLFPTTGLDASRRSTTNSLSTNTADADKSSQPAAVAASSSPPLLTDLTSGSGSMLQREFNRIRGLISDSAVSFVSRRRDIIRIFHKFNRLASETAQKLVAHWVVSTDMVGRLPLTIELSGLIIYILGDIEPITAQVPWENEDSFKIAHREVAARIDAASLSHLNATVQIPLCAAVHVAGFDFFVEASLQLTKDTQLGGLSRPVTDQFRVLPSGEGVPHVNRQTEFITRAIGMTKLMSLKHRAANTNAFLPSETRIDMGPDGDYYVRALARARPPLLEINAETMSLIKSLSKIESMGGGTGASSPRSPRSPARKPTSEDDSVRPPVASPFGVPTGPNVRRLTVAGSCPPPWSALSTAACHKLRERSEYRLLPSLMEEYALGTALSPDSWAGKMPLPNVEGEVLEVNRILHLVAVPRLANFFLILDRISILTGRTELDGTGQVLRLAPNRQDSPLHSHTAAYDNLSEVVEESALRGLFLDAMNSQSGGVPEGRLAVDRNSQSFSSSFVEARFLDLLLYSAQNPNFRLTCGRIKKIFHTFGVNMRLIGRVIELIEDAIVHARRLVDPMLHSHVLSPEAGLNPRLPVVCPAPLATFYSGHQILKMLRTEMAARAAAYVLRRQWTERVSNYFRENYEEDSKGVLRRAAKKVEPVDPRKGAPVSSLMRFIHAYGNDNNSSAPTPPAASVNSSIISTNESSFLSGGSIRRAEGGGGAGASSSSSAKKILSRTSDECAQILNAMLAKGTIETLTAITGDNLAAVNGTDEAFWASYLIPMIRHKFGYEWVFYRELKSASNVMGGAKSTLSTGARVRARHQPQSSADMWAKTFKCPMPRPLSLTQMEVNSWGLMAPPSLDASHPRLVQRLQNPASSNPTASVPVAHLSYSNRAPTVDALLSNKKETSPSPAIMSSLSHHNTKNGSSQTPTINAPSPLDLSRGVPSMNVHTLDLIEHAVSRVYEQRIEDHEYLTSDEHPEGFLLPVTEADGAVGGKSGTVGWGEVLEELSSASKSKVKPMAILLGERQDVRLVQRVCVLCSITLVSDLNESTGVSVALAPIVKGMKTREILSPTQLRHVQNGVVDPIVTSMRNEMRAQRKLWGSTAEYRQLEPLHTISELFRLQSRFLQCADVCKRFCDVLVHDNGHNFIGLVEANLHVARALSAAKNEKAALQHAQHAVQLATEHTNNRSQLLTRSLLTLLDLYESFENNNSNNRNALSQHQQHQNVFSSSMNSPLSASVSVFEGSMRGGGGGTSGSTNYTKKKIELAMRLQPLCAGESRAVSVARIEARAALLQLQHAISTLKQKEKENETISGEIEEYKKALRSAVEEEKRKAVERERKLNANAAPKGGDTPTANPAHSPKTPTGGGMGIVRGNQSPSTGTGTSSRGTVAYAATAVTSSRAAALLAAKKPRKLIELAPFQSDVKTAEENLASSIADALRSQGVDDELLFFIIKYAAYAKKIELLPILCQSVSVFVHITSPHFVQCVNTLGTLLSGGIAELQDAATVRSVLLKRRQEETEEREKSEHIGVSQRGGNQKERKLGGEEPKPLRPLPITTTLKKRAVVGGGTAQPLEINSDDDMDEGKMGGHFQRRNDGGAKTLQPSSYPKTIDARGYSSKEEEEEKKRREIETNLEPSLGLLYSLFSDPQWSDERAYDVQQVVENLRPFATIHRDISASEQLEDNIDKGITLIGGGGVYKSEKDKATIIIGKGFNFSSTNTNNDQKGGGYIAQQGFKVSSPASLRKSPDVSFARDGSEPIKVKQTKNSSDAADAFISLVSSSMGRTRVGEVDVAEESTASESMLLGASTRSRSMWQSMRNLHETQQKNDRKRSRALMRPDEPDTTSSSSSSSYSESSRSSSSSRGSSVSSSSSDEDNIFKRKDRTKVGFQKGKNAKRKNREPRARRGLNSTLSYDAAFGDTVVVVDGGEKDTSSSSRRTSNESDTVLSVVGKDTNDAKKTTGNNNNNLLAIEKGSNNCVAKRRSVTISFRGNDGIVTKHHDTENDRRYKDHNDNGTTLGERKRRKMPLSLLESLMAVSAVTLYRRWLRAILKAIPPDAFNSPWTWDEKTVVGPYCVLLSEVSEMCVSCPVIGFRCCLALADELELTQKQLAQQKLNAEAVARTVPTPYSLHSPLSSCRDGKLDEGQVIDPSDVKIVSLLEVCGVSYSNPLAGEPCPLQTPIGQRRQYSPLAAPYLHRIALLLWSATTKELYSEGHLAVREKSAFVSEPDPRRLPRFELMRSFFGFADAIKNLLQCLRGLYAMDVPEHLNAVAHYIAEELGALESPNPSPSNPAARKASIFGTAEFSSPPPHNIHSHAQPDHNAKRADERDFTTGTSQQVPCGLDSSGNNDAVRLLQRQREAASPSASLYSSLIASSVAMQLSEHVPKCMQALIASLFIGIEVGMTDKQLCFASSSAATFEALGLGAVTGGGASSRSPASSRRKSQINPLHVPSPSGVTNLASLRSQSLYSPNSPNHQHQRIPAPNPLSSSSGDRPIFTVGLPQGLLVRLHLTPSATPSPPTSARRGLHVAVASGATTSRAAGDHLFGDLLEISGGGVGSNPIAEGIAIVPRHSQMDLLIESTQRVPPHLVLAYNWPFHFIFRSLKKKILAQVAPIIHLLGEQYPLQKSEMWGSFASFLLYLFEEEQRLYTPRYCRAEAERRLAQTYELYWSSDLIALVGRAALGSLSGQKAVESLRNQFLTKLLGESAVARILSMNDGEGIVGGDEGGRLGTSRAGEIGNARQPANQKKRGEPFSGSSSAKPTKGRMLPPSIAANTSFLNSTTFSPALLNSVSSDALNLNSDFGGESSRKASGPLNSILREAWKRKRQRTFTVGPPVFSSTLYDPIGLPFDLGEADVQAVEQAGLESLGSSSSSSLSRILSPSVAENNTVTNGNWMQNATHNGPLTKSQATKAFLRKVFDSWDAEGSSLKEKIHLDLEEAARKAEALILATVQGNQKEKKKRRRGSGHEGEEGYGVHGVNEACGNEVDTTGSGSNRRLSLSSSSRIHIFSSIVPPQLKSTEINRERPRAVEEKQTKNNEPTSTIDSGKKLKKATFGGSQITTVVYQHREDEQSESTEAKNVSPPFAAATNKKGGAASLPSLNPKGGAHSLIPAPFSAKSSAPSAISLSNKNKKDLRNKSPLSLSPDDLGKRRSAASASLDVASSSTHAAATRIHSSPLYSSTSVGIRVLFGSQTSNASPHTASRGSASGGSPWSRNPLPAIRTRPSPLPAHADDEAYDYTNDRGRGRDRVKYATEGPTIALGTKEIAIEWKTRTMAPPASAFIGIFELQISIDDHGVKTVANSIVPSAALHVVKGLAVRRSSGRIGLECPQTVGTFVVALFHQGSAPLLVSDPFTISLQ